MSGLMVLVACQELVLSGPWPYHQPDSFALPSPSDHDLRVIHPRLLEVYRITTKAPDPQPVSDWNFIINTNQLVIPSTDRFQVLMDDRPVGVENIGFRRRPVYAPLREWDLR
ncbi:MAG TPA: hypothetical protein PK256_25050, partial [Verrucomicrobiota bacterium]|nr:hypothetical protein [Verrucomicrobiota bacterium]